ncbi:MAG TPA: hypothetical protein VH518_12265, partial [Tepidisphaeraceae bacterium]
MKSHVATPRPAEADALRGPTPGRFTVGALLAACFLVFGSVLLFYARGQILSVIVVMLLDGGVAALWILAAVLLGSVVIKLFRVQAGGLLWFVTSAGLGLGLFSLMMFGMSLAGIASRLSIIGIMIVLGGAGLTMLLHEHRGKLGEPLAPIARASLRRPVTWPWLWLVAMPFLAITVAGACLPPGMLWWPNDPHPYDVLSYHLQIPREWYEAGRMVPLHHNVFSFFPFNAEMHFLASMFLRGGPWEGVYTAQFMSVGFALLSVLTIYAGLTPSPWQGEGGGACGERSRPEGLNSGREDDSRSHGSPVTPTLSPPGRGSRTIAAVLVAVMP